jgi:hypothetical protein
MYKLYVVQEKLLIECWSLVKYNDNANLKFDANTRVQNDVQFVSKIVVHCIIFHMIFIG